jgi:glucosamine-phosphate N-acetyltransferase
MKLFDEKFISPAVKSSLKDGFTVRPLEKSDYDKGFLECLSMLTFVGKMPRSTQSE